MKKSIFAALFLLLPLSSQAEMVFTPSIFYHSYERSVNGTTVSDGDTLMLNLKFGVVSNSMYLGVVYDMENEGDIARDDDKRAYGVGIGYISGGWNLHLSYFFKAELNSGTDKYEGDGLSFDIGYVFMNGNWGIGPVLTHRRFNYDEYNGATVDFETVDTLPMVMLQFLF